MPIIFSTVLWFLAHHKVGSRICRNNEGSIFHFPTSKDKLDILLCSSFLTEFRLLLHDIKKIIKSQRNTVKQKEKMLLSFLCIEKERMVVFMNITQAVVARIDELCAKRTYTVNGISTISGMTQSTVNDIMKGTTQNPGIVTLHKLCVGLDISVRDFFDSPLFVDLEPPVK